MSSQSIAFDFVFGAMTPAERAQTKLRRQYDRALAAEIDCIESKLSPLALAAEDVAPSSDLWTRIEADIEQDGADYPGMTSECFEDGGWTAWAGGIDVKPIWDGASFLVRCAPGAVIAPHHHHVDERMLVINGSIKVGARLLRPGDCQFSPAGSAHGEIRSAEGCTMLIQRIAQAA